MTTVGADPFAKLKSVQREAWSLFAPLEITTIIPAARLVKFAQLTPGERVLDVACGTGVVAVTAARAGCRVSGLDLSPVLVEHARGNAAVAEIGIDFVEGDAEALPYPDASFDVVLSQFGHIFAPRPEIVTAEMLRVLRPGGRIAFSTWPPELFIAKQLALYERYLPPSGHAPPPSPILWGDPNVVTQRLGTSVRDLKFERDILLVPSLGPLHMRRFQEAHIALLTRVVAALEREPAKLAQLRAEFEALITDYLEDNQVRQHYLMTRATKAT